MHDPTPNIPTAVLAKGALWKRDDEQVMEIIALAAMYDSREPVVVYRDKLGNKTVRDVMAFIAENDYIGLRRLDG